MIDWVRVEGLRNDMGDDGFAEVVELFLQEMDDRISSMKTETARNRAEDLHFLKGSGANLGFKALVEECVLAEADETMALAGIWECFETSKVEFLSDTKIHMFQIKTPESTSSSVISR